MLEFGHLTKNLERKIKSRLAVVNGHHSIGIVITKVMVKLLKSFSLSELLQSLSNWSKLDKEKGCK